MAGIVEMVAKSVIRIFAFPGAFIFWIISHRQIPFTQYMNLTFSGTNAFVGFLAVLGLALAVSLLLLL